MNTFYGLFNVVLVIMIVSTMFTAGLGITFGELGATFRKVWLVVLVLTANLIIVPLLGWGAAALFSLATPAYVALVLIACSPGGPFGAKLAMIQRGNIVAGSSMQVLLAAIGSVTFAVAANLILRRANLGGGISLPVWDLVRTVVLLQVIPFLVGLSIRRWSPETASNWRPYSLKTSTLSLILVLAGAISGSWHQIVDLLGSTTLFAALLFTVAVIVVGGLFAVGSMETRTTMALVTLVHNSGPVFAAIGIAFNNSPAILGSGAAIVVVQLVIAVPLAAYLARNRRSPGQVIAVAPGQNGAATTTTPQEAIKAGR